MRRFKIATVVVLALLVSAGVGTALVLYFDNVHNARMAEGMMNEAALLRVDKSGLADVVAFAAKYHGTTTGKWHLDPCVATDCLAVAGVSSYGGFWARHPKLSDWRDHLFRRAWQYSVLMWVENGKLVAQQQWLEYGTPRRTVAVITETSDPSPKLCSSPSFRLHHAFTVNFAPHHFNVWVDANASDFKRLLNLNINCVTRLAGCTAVSDMVPAAWQHYEADQQVFARQPDAPDETSD